MSDVHDDVAAYLLGALDEREKAAFESHLSDCADCRSEVEHLRVAAEALPASPAPLAPPPELKDRIMNIVRAEAELLRAAGPEADRPPERPRRRRSWSLGWRPAFALATVLAVGAFVGILVSGGSGVDTRTVVASVARDGASAKLIERDSGHSTLVATKLPNAGPGRVYQVWLERDGKPQPTDALFRVRADGSASVDVPGSLKGVKRVMVTSEPDGGSTTPTLPVVITADV